MNIDKPLLKKIFLAIIWIMVGTGFVILWVSAVAVKRNLTCRAVNIQIEHFEDALFISPADINQLIGNTDTLSLVGHPISEFDLKALERKVTSSPYVSGASLFFDNKQNLEIHVTPRRPLIRIINNIGVGFYVDENGHILPLSSTFTPRLLVATGSIYSSDFNTTRVTKSKRYDLIDLVNKINKDQLLKASIGQVEVNENGEMTLFLNLTNHPVLLGKSDNLDEKLSRLKIFTKEIWCKVGWDTYDKIDVRWDRQVIGWRKGEAVVRRKPQEKVETNRVDNLAARDSTALSNIKVSLPKASHSEKIKNKAAQPAKDKQAKTSSSKSKSTKHKSTQITPHSPKLHSPK